MFVLIWYKMLWEFAQTTGRNRFDYKFDKEWKTMLQPYDFGLMVKLYSVTGVGGADLHHSRLNIRIWNRNESKKTKNISASVETFSFFYLHTADAQTNQTQFSNVSGPPICEYKHFFVFKSKTASNDSNGGHHSRIAKKHFGWSRFPTAESEHLTGTKCEWQSGENREWEEQIICHPFSEQSDTAVQAEPPINQIAHTFVQANCGWLVSATQFGVIER